MMKNLLFLFVSVILFSCSSGNKDKSAIENNKETTIVGRWKLEAHEDKSISNKKIDVKIQPTQIVLNIQEGGYFIIYDTFIDPKFSQKGFNRISERAKGQWELKDDKRLVLYYNESDSTKTEELVISKLTNSTLITKGKNRKANIYKTYKGY